EFLLRRNPGRQNRVGVARTNRCSRSCLQPFHIASEEGEIWQDVPKRADSGIDDPLRRGGRLTVFFSVPGDSNPAQNSNLRDNGDRVVSVDTSFGADLIRQRLVISESGWWKLDRIEDVLRTGIDRAPWISIRRVDGLVGCVRFPHASRATECEVVLEKPR